MGISLVNDFLIGCDPEFVAMDGNGAVVNCSRHIAHDGELGHDHGGWVLEFRPSPEKSTWKLISKLRKLVMDQRLTLIPGLKKARAGAYVAVPERRALTLGGHVHIDIDPYRHEGAGGMTREHEERVGALDRLTQYLEGLDILPTGESHARRMTSGYGKYGDVRVQKKVDGSGRQDPNPRPSQQPFDMAVHQHTMNNLYQQIGLGGQQFTQWSAASNTIAPPAPPSPPLRYKYHTEYRTMASWMFDPKVAMLCLTGAKLAAAEPAITYQTLIGAPSFTGLKSWYELFRSKDINAKRVCDTILDEGIKKVQVQPDVDFRERWT